MTAGQATIEERHLLQTMRWWDGFVVALCNPGFLIAAFGFSVGALGPWGSIVVWAVSATLGALQAWIYQEPAAMFPHKSGGIALYAHEGWKKHFSLVGPIATFGYWFGWSSVLSIFGLVIGSLAQGAWFPNSTWSFGILGLSHFTPAKLIAVLCIAFVWMFNYRGMRPAVWVSYVTGILLCVPLFVVMFAFLSGTFHMPTATFDFSTTAADGTVTTGAPTWTVILVWLYLMGWSSYAAETCAAFAPEYKDTVGDTAKALRSASLFNVLVFFLLPLGVIGTIGADGITGENASGGYLVEAMKKIVGGGATGFLIAFVIAGLLLSMNTATMDGSRALYGISKDDMTVKWLGRLNRFHVPGNAMLVDAVFNLTLLVVFDSTLAILAASNLGYVLAHIAALTGFILLRRDRPNAARPIRVSSLFVPIAGLLALANLVFVGYGFTNFALTGYASTDANGNPIQWFGVARELWLGVLILLVGVALFLYRRTVEDKQKFTWRDADVPPVPVS
jgi:amino acid transporter